MLKPIAQHKSTGSEQRLHTEKKEPEVSPSGRETHGGGSRAGGPAGRQDGGTAGRQDGGTAGQQDGRTAGRWDGGTAPKKERHLMSIGVREQRVQTLNAAQRLKKHLNLLLS